MAQCQEVHPLSPNPGIFLCIKDSTHVDEHHTYDVNGRDYFWLGNVIFITEELLRRVVHRGL